VTDPATSTAGAPASPPSAREISAEPHPTRKAVLAAMARILASKPTIVHPGTQSIAGLAREAQINRNHLTRGSCRDLADRFSALTHAQTTPATAREAQQHHQISQLTDRLDQLKVTHAALRTDRDRWKAATHTLLRAIQVMRLEHQAMAADLELLRRQAHGPRTGQPQGLYVVPSPNLLSRE
jgi:hypothetical protein